MTFSASTSGRWHSPFVFIFAFLGLVSALFAETPASFQLAATAQVDSTGIFLQQLVKSDQPLPSVRLTDAPALGGTVSFTRAQISSLLATAAPNLIVSNLDGSDSIEISRRMHTLSENAVLALLTGSLQRDYIKDRGQLELNFTQPWTAPTVPDEPLTVKMLELPNGGVTHSFIIRFQLCTAGETVDTWQSSLQARVWRDVWVAHTTLQRGQLVSESDVTRERRDVLPISESLADFSADDSSLQFGTTIEAGNILLARDLKPRTVMHRGQIADGLLQDGSLNIMMKVEVLEDGAPGQIVKIRNPVSMHNLSGKVVNDQTIMISL
jgi:flagella basal body P-ring formation protein FlgA